MQMKKRYNPALYAAAKLDHAHTDGVIQGFDATISLVLIAGYNIYQDYFESPEEFANFFKAWENETARIFCEECHGDPEEIFSAIKTGTEQLRERLEIDG